MSGATSFESFRTFPPFYTLQPHLETRERQLSLWCDLLLSSKDLFYLSSEVSLFRNDAIQRRVQGDLFEAIVERLIRQGHLTKGSDGKLLLWPKKPGEYVDILLGYVQEMGLTNGAVVTLFELMNESPLSILPESHWEILLQTLEANKNVALISGGNLLETGLKFQ